MRAPHLRMKGSALYSNANAVADIFRSPVFRSPNLKLLLLSKVKSFQKCHGAVCFETPIQRKCPPSHRQRIVCFCKPTSDDTMLLSLQQRPERSYTESGEEEETHDNVIDSFIEDSDWNVNPNHRSGYVAVIGKPNVGKSTLINQMIGQKLSIVTEKPQTTRHRILGLCSEPDYQIVLYDTPGVLQKKTHMHKMDSMMMKNVHYAAVNADCALIVVDACKIPEKVDDQLEGYGGNFKEKVPTLLIVNKKDLIKPGEIAKRVEWYEKFGGVDNVMPVSAKYGHGIEDIKKWIVSQLPYGPAYFPKNIVSAHPERFFISEIVREKIFMQYRQEVPYACQVNVVSYIARPTSKDYVEIEIIVERDTQKIILIGKGGKALKHLATAARRDIEDFMQKEVYMEIKVKVRPHWRRDEAFLKQYGYAGEISA
eukprot:TRINITY_DN5256_c0_g1_i1.p1 TRINITY_DN5256_c0_g1~~TRINITY_DN5256_c0_g1_i1.p1  ORF type:complete len:425 (+),score=73.28 TRINITY_DN5256_c0_g1_i1:152-1426(+)